MSSNKPQTNTPMPQLTFEQLEEEITRITEQYFTKGVVNPYTICSKLEEHFDGKTKLTFSRYSQVWDHVKKLIDEYLQYCNATRFETHGHSYLAVADALINNSLELATDVEVPYDVRLDAGAAAMSQNNEKMNFLIAIESARRAQAHVVPDYVLEQEQAEIRQLSADNRSYAERVADRIKESRRKLKEKREKLNARTGIS